MDSLEEIRRRKMRRMEKMLKEKQLQNEQSKRERDEVERVLSQVLSPDALKYLATVRSSSPSVAGRIEEIVIALVVQRRIRQKIDKVIIKAIERKVRGIEPTISYVKKGKRMEISEKLREED